MSAASGAALQSVGQGLMSLGLRSAEHDFQRERQAAEAEMRLKAEERAEARGIASEQRGIQNKRDEEQRVIDRRKGILTGVNAEFDRITANRASDAEMGGFDTTPAPNKAAMIRDAAAISDPDLARLYGETEGREYQRTRDTKADERTERQFEHTKNLSEAQLSISKRQMGLAESKNTADQDMIKRQTAAAQKYVAATTDADKQAALSEYVGANGKRKDLTDEADFTIKSLTNLALALNMTDPEGAGEAAGFALGVARQGASQRGLAKPKSAETKTINGMTYEKVAGGWQRVGK